VVEGPPRHAAGSGADGAPRAWRRGPSTPPLARRGPPPLHAQGRIWC